MNGDGAIDATWLATARENEHDGQTVEKWIGNWIKSAVRIDMQGRVFAETLGRNLNQGEIDEACEAVDNFA